MAYDPNLYSPYGQQYPLIHSNNQPTNGLIRVESVEGARMYAMPPNSVSPPLMLGSDNVFFIKTTDGGGAGSLKAYRFEEIDVPGTSSNDEQYVTKEYFDSWAEKLMEAINGEHSISEQPTAE